MHTVRSGDSDGSNFARPHRLCRPPVPAALSVNRREVRDLADAFYNTSHKQLTVRSDRLVICIDHDLIEESVYFHFQTPQNISFINESFIKLMEGNYALNCDGTVETALDVNNYLVNSTDTPSVISTIFADPSFDLAIVDTGDIHLISGAPVINLGVLANSYEYGAVSSDIDGKGRNKSEGDNEYNIDIGCDEFNN